jgi:hypothetical protein
MLSRTLSKPLTCLSSNLTVQSKTKEMKIVKDRMKKLPSKTQTGLFQIKYRSIM